MYSTPDTNDIDFDFSHNLQKNNHRIFKFLTNFYYT